MQVLSQERLINAEAARKFDRLKVGASTSAALVNSGRRRDWERWPPCSLQLWHLAACKRKNVQLSLKSQSLQHARTRVP